MVTVLNAFKIPVIECIYVTKFLMIFCSIYPSLSNEYNVKKIRRIFYITYFI